MRFAGPEAYLDFWAGPPGLGPALDGPQRPDVVRAYLTTTSSRTRSRHWVSSCVLEAIRADGADVLAHRGDPRRCGQAVDLRRPTEFLWAARGLQNEAQGLYDEGRIAALACPRNPHHGGRGRQPLRRVLAGPGSPRSRTPSAASSTFPGDLRAATNPSRMPLGAGQSGRSGGGAAARAGARAPVRLLPGGTEQGGDAFQPLRDGVDVHVQDRGGVAGAAPGGEVGLQCADQVGAARLVVVEDGAEERRT